MLNMPLFPQFREKRRLGVCLQIHFAFLDFRALIPGSGHIFWWFCSDSSKLAWSLPLSLYRESGAKFSSSLAISHNFVAKTTLSFLSPYAPELF